MDEIAKNDPGTIPCTYCGVFRRKALNSKAKEIRADYLATGLNLDDTAQSVLMNFAKNFPVRAISKSFFTSSGLAIVAVLGKRSSGS